MILYLLFPVSVKLRCKRPYLQYLPRIPKVCLISIQCKHSLARTRMTKWTVIAEESLAEATKRSSMVPFDAPFLVTFSVHI